jgi:hypothetical protein
MVPTLTDICSHATTARWRIFTTACAFSGAVLANGCGDAVTDMQATYPAPVQGLNAQVSGRTVHLSWSEPSTPDVAGSLVGRFPAGGVDAEPEPQRTYEVGESLGSGVVVFAGRAAEFIDSPPCEEHHYAVWARNTAGNWSLEARTVRVAELPGSPVPSPLTRLTAVIDGTTVLLAWTPASEPPDALVRIVRGRDVGPSDPADGETVFFGAASAAVDRMPEVSPLVTWHYAAYACNPCGVCETEGIRVQVTPTLMESLAVGGFVVFWRHATAEVCLDQTDLGTAADTAVPNWWRSCDRDCPPDGNATARQLSPEGYAEADAVGAALRARGIHFDRLLSSEFCRCSETAERMDLGVDVEMLPAITNFVYPEHNRCAALDTLLALPPKPGANTAIFGHASLSLGVNCPSLPDMQSIEPAEAAIYRPDGAGGHTFVTMVRASEWVGLP